MGEKKEARRAGAKQLLKKAMKKCEGQKDVKRCVKETSEKAFKFMRKSEKNSDNVFSRDSRDAGESKSFKLAQACRKTGKSWDICKAKFTKSLEKTGLTEDSTDDALQRVRGDIHRAAK